jgi:hypothetical protein
MAPASLTGSGHSTGDQDGPRRLPSTTPVGANAHPHTFFPVVLCEIGHRVFSPNWISPDGDTSHGDPQAYHRLTKLQQQRVDLLSSKTDSDLRTIFQNFLIQWLKDGKLGLDMIDRFYVGSQEAFRHHNGSVLSEMAKQTSSFLSHAGSVRDQIGSHLIRPITSHSTDYRYLKKQLNIQTVNFDTTIAAYGDFIIRRSGNDLTLKSLIGGTQGLKITLENISFYRNHSPNYTMFSVDLRYEIFDVFGVGSSDIYTGLSQIEDFKDALVAFWILQHMREGHRPFINWIEIEYSAIGGHL